MLNLLRADFYKFKLDKTFLVILVILMGFVMMNTVTYFILRYMELDPALGALIGEMNGKGLFLMSFNLFNNVGLLIPVVLCLFIGKEFTFGTIRNKLITGKSRTEVYLSHLFTVFVMGLLLSAFYAIMSLLVGSVFLGFGTAITGKVIVDTLKIFLFGLILSIFSYTISTFFSFVLKNTTFAIVLSIVTLLVIGIVATTLTGLNATLDKVLGFTVIGQSLAVMSGNVSTIMGLKILLSTVVFCGLITFLGIVHFKHADLK